MASAKHFVSSRPGLMRCDVCHRRTLVGIDSGMPYEVDAYPVNVLGEIVARLAGKSTYWLMMPGRYLVYRDKSNIDADGARGRPLVLAAHRHAPIITDHIDQSMIGAVSKLLVLTAQKTDIEIKMQRALLVLTDIIPAKVISATDEPPF